MFDAGPLYIENFNAPEKVLVNQGGTSSGKTYTIMQLLYHWAVKHNRFVITVIGESIPNLKKGAYRDAETIFELTPELADYITSWNKTDRIIYFKNGSIIEFTSYETEQSAKNGKRDVAFFNEANGISYQIYWQVARRTRHKVILDYNPSAEFWAHEKVIGKPGTRLIISDHRHNLWLTQEQHREIESIRDEDEELWKVYARGLTGKIEGLVFRNTVVVDQFPHVTGKLISFGLDFGFTNDPTACIEVRMQDGELWVQEHLYERGLTNQDIAQKLNHLKANRYDLVCDSAEPKSIEELKRLGLKVEPAQKGPDSIKNSIDILKRYTINVTRGSVNLRKELDNYKWKVDKTTGKPTGEPIDAFNHAIDALRYVALNRLSHGTKPKRPTKAAGSF